MARRAKVAASGTTEKYRGVPVDSTLLPKICLLYTSRCV